MHHRQHELDARGAGVLVVSFDPEEQVAQFRRHHDLDFPCFADESRAIYRAYGLNRGSWRQTLTLKALAPYARMLLSGRAVRAAPGQDIRQRGGDFVVGRDGRLTLAYASDDPSDRPAVASIIAACR
ncbi:MAG: redoxin domain-containing protein [Chloroflexi bacterium]|nr:redoxin domain-containing protein [Chloroflexota bacterium]